MTVAPQAEALVFDDIDDPVGALRARGLRVSIARRLVLELLFGATGRVSAEHVASTLAIDAASVYGNLHMLERRGLVHHVHLGHGPGALRPGRARGARVSVLRPLRHGSKRAGPLPPSRRRPRGSP